MDCPACKARNESDARFCGNCGRRLSSVDATPGASGIPAASGAAAVVVTAAAKSNARDLPMAALAGRWQRFGAWAIDSVVIWLVVVVAGDRLVRFYLGNDGGPFDFYPRLSCSWIIGRTIYNTIFTAARGQTPGKTGTREE